MPAATVTSSTDGHERRALARNPNRTAGDRDTGTGAQRLYHVRHVRSTGSKFVVFTTHASMPKELSAKVHMQAAPRTPHPHPHAAHYRRP